MAGSITVLHPAVNRGILGSNPSQPGVSQTAVADIEREAIKNPRVETLVKIAQALELEPMETADLIGINLYKDKK